MTATSALSARRTRTPSKPLRPRTRSPTCPWPRPATRPRGGVPALASEITRERGSSRGSCSAARMRMLTGAGPRCGGSAFSRSPAASLMTRGRRTSGPPSGGFAICEGASSRSSCYFKHAGGEKILRTDRVMAARFYARFEITEGRAPDGVCASLEFENGIVPSFVGDDQCPFPVRRLCIGRFQVGQHCDDAFRGNAHNQRLRLPGFTEEPGGGYWGEVLGLQAFGHVSAEGKDSRE